MIVKNRRPRRRALLATFREYRKCNRQERLRPTKLGQRIGGRVQRRWYRHPGVAATRGTSTSHAATRDRSFTTDRANTTEDSHGNRTQRSNALVSLGSRPGRGTVARVGLLAADPSAGRASPQSQAVPAAPCPPPRHRKLSRNGGSSQTCASPPMNSWNAATWGGTSPSLNHGLIQRLGGCDLLLIKGFHYWQGDFDDSSWGYPRFRDKIAALTPRLHRRASRPGLRVHPARKISRRARTTSGSWASGKSMWTRASTPVRDEESGRSGLDIPTACLDHCDQLRATFKSPVGIFLYGRASRRAMSAKSPYTRTWSAKWAITCSGSPRRLRPRRGDQGLVRRGQEAKKEGAAYWTGAMLPAEKQGPGTPFWRERFGRRGLGDYFRDYTQAALHNGPRGCIFIASAAWSAPAAPTSGRYFGHCKPERKRKMMAGLLMRRVCRPLPRGLKVIQEQLVLLPISGPFAADKVFQVDAHFPQFRACSCDVRSRAAARPSC